MTDEILESSIFVFDHRGARVSIGTGNDQGSELVEVGRSHRFGESQFASKDWGYSDLIGLNIDVGGDN